MSTLPRISLSPASKQKKVARAALKLQLALTLKDDRRRDVRLCGGNVDRIPLLQQPKILLLVSKNVANLFAEERRLRERDPAVVEAANLNKIRAKLFANS